jgi:hypothetical protein
MHLILTNAEIMVLSYIFSKLEYTQGCSRLERNPIAFAGLALVARLATKLVTLRRTEQRRSRECDILWHGDLREGRRFLEVGSQLISWNFNKRVCEMAVCVATALAASVFWHRRAGGKLRYRGLDLGRRKDFSGCIDGVCESEVPACPICLYNAISCFASAASFTMWVKSSPKHSMHSVHRNWRLIANVSIAWVASIRRRDPWPPVQPVEVCAFDFAHCKLNAAMARQFKCGIGFAPPGFSPTLDLPHAPRTHWVIE